MSKTAKKLKNRQGFTLVELIVVLMILAILAALLIQSLTGYIDKAKERTVAADMRTIILAAQTLVDEAYATCPQDSTISFVKDTKTEYVQGNPEISLGAVAALAEVPGQIWQDNIVLELENNKVSENKARIIYMKYQYGEQPADVYYYSWSQQTGAVYSKIDPKANS